eukprot:jgi/Mesen1/3001/ME000177S02268
MELPQFVLGTALRLALGSSSHQKVLSEALLASRHVALARATPVPHPRPFGLHGAHQPDNQGASPEGSERAPSLEPLRSILAPVHTSQMHLCACQERAPFFGAAPDSKPYTLNSYILNPHLSPAICALFVILVSPCAVARVGSTAAGGGRSGGGGGTHDFSVGGRPSSLAANVAHVSSYAHIGHKSLDRFESKLHAYRHPGAGTRAGAGAADASTGGSHRHRHSQSIVCRGYQVIGDDHESLGH